MSPQRELQGAHWDSLRQKLLLDLYPMMSYGKTKQRREMHTIKITVEAGCVVEVDGLPDGFDYEIIDKDTQQEEKEE